MPINCNKPKSIYMDSTEGESDEDTPRSYQVPRSIPVTKPLLKGAAGSRGTTPLKTPSVEFSADEDHIYEMEPTPIYESTDLDNGAAGDIKGDETLYENTDFTPLRDLPSRESLTRKFSSPANLGGSSSATPTTNAPTPSGNGHKRRRHTPDDYEDPDAVLDDLEAEERGGDYVDMDSSQHNTYIDPEELRRGGSGSSASSGNPPLPATPSSSSFARTESTSSVPGPSECTTFELRLQVVGGASGCGMGQGGQPI